MRALVVAAPGKMEYREFEKPVPGPYEVVCRVAYCGICGTDAEIYFGDTSMAKSGQFHYPVRIGHEWSGIVESVGSEVTDFRPGDRVISDTASSCGTCDACLRGEFLKCDHISALGTVFDHKAGAFADYIVMFHWHLHKLPGSIGLDEAALIEPGTNALHALEISGLVPGDTVLIAGTGAIGLMAAALAKRMGFRVLLAGRKPFKLDIGRKVGADATVNMAAQDLKAFVSENTSGKGVDLFLDTTGAASVINQAFDLLAYSGKIEMIAFYGKKLEQIDLNRLVIGQNALMGSEGTGWSAGRFVELMAGGGLNVRPIITQKVPFEDAARAIMEYRTDTDLKIKTLVRIGPDES